jgi:hypothetical protein
MKHRSSAFCRRVAALLLLAFFAVPYLPAGAANGFRYVHDPALNSSAMKDIVADETAVYGFRPSETGSLAMYAHSDWSDPALVEQGRRERIAYHESIESMYDMLKEMQAQGKTTEEIARAVSTERNRIRLAVYADDPEGLAAVKARNLEKYGHEEGPLPDELYEQYGSWTAVMQKSFSTNSGMDACLGLYDDYYFLYVELGYVPAQVEIKLPESLKCRYLKTVSVTAQITADTTNYTVRFVSDDPETASVDDNGVVTGLKRGEANIRCVVTDASGAVHESQPCRLQVRYTLLQWFIRIFLFGWAWYGPAILAA